MIEVFASLFVSSIITFFALTFLYIFDIFNERNVKTAVHFVVVLILHAMIFSLIYLVLLLKATSQS